MTTALEKFWLANPDAEHPTAVAYLQKHGFEDEDPDYMQKRSYAVRWTLDNDGRLRTARSKLTKAKNAKKKAKKNGQQNGLADPRLSLRSNFLRRWWLAYLHTGTHPEAAKAAEAAGCPKKDPNSPDDESYSAKSWAKRQPVQRRIKPANGAAPEATPASALPTDGSSAPAAVTADGAIAVLDPAGLSTDVVIEHAERMCSQARALQKTSPIDAAGQLMHAKRMIDVAVERRTAALIEA
jgi:hypothetical protein